MSGLTYLVKTELLLFARTPISLFFTLIFPILLIVIFGNIYGNIPVSMFNDRGSIDVYTPCFLALIIATATISSLSIKISVDKKNGYLKLLKTTPLGGIWQLAVCEFAWVSIVCIVSGILMIVTAWVLFDLNFYGSAIELIAVFIVGLLFFFSLGFMLAGLYKNARTAQSVSMVLFYPMIFLSGATIPIEMLPENLLVYSQFIPLTPLVDALKGVWMGQPIENYSASLIQMLSLTIVFLVLTKYSFKWSE
ncbi:MAG: ABC transporter permease [Gammaproteobacteria bacterium]|nr:ABC transporter permease [Gammaproteobacteria bacterium]MDH5731399.1 ABC transporter permease [Gammaproteobacteria bacterium]